MPARLAKLMILPLWRLRIPGSTALAQRKGPRRLTCTSFHHAMGSTSRERSCLLNSDAELKAFFQKSVGFVSVNPSLADAKRAMGKIDKCRDVFVTQSGDRKEPILGWITDSAIRENLRV